MDFANVIGRRLAKVELSPDKQTLTLSFQDGKMVTYGVDGECCSTSWIEHLELPGDVHGLTIISVEEIGMGEQRSPEHECLRLYETRFHTLAGDIVLEYRNSSNGYYGGSLTGGLEGSAS